MNRARTMCILAGPAAALLLAASTVPLAPTFAQSAAPAGGTPATHHKLPPTNRMPRTAAGQNRELDEIGNKLLRETPKKPVATTASEGGGLEPPTH